MRRLSGRLRDHPRRSHTNHHAQGHCRRHRIGSARGRDGAPGVRACGQGNPALLLSRAAVDRRQLPHVPGRSRARPAQAAGELRSARRRRPGDPHRHRDGQEGPRRGDGVPAHQSPARLPDLRSGRRMRSAGPGDGLRPQLLALRREQAGDRRQIYGPGDQDRDDPLHPVHALHPLCRGSRRRAGNRHALPRRGCADHHLSGKDRDQRACRQSGRRLPGRSAAAEAAELRDAPVGAAPGAGDRRDGRGRVQHPPRRPPAAGDARASARQ